MSQSHQSEENVLRTVRGIWNQVSVQTDLSPRNAVINCCLTRLVGEVMSEDPSSCSTGFSCVRQLKDEGVCDKIRYFCQDCEYQMECFWAKKIVNAARQRQSL